ncbi:MAG: hypothetical protein JSR64_20890 [Nitrospira sp.]|nr:hypothetical protein [Nitrospira sp.]
MGLHFDYLLNAARWAPSADNTQPWQLRCDDGILAVAYDKARVEGVTFPPNDPATLIAMGAVLENLLQASAATGLSVERVQPGEDEYFRLLVSETSTSSPGPDSHPLFLRHTNRLPFRTTPLPRPLVEKLLNEREETACVQLLEGKHDLARIAGLVRQASTIRFQTRESNESLGRSLRFTPREVSRGDGLDVATLNLPPGGRGIMRLMADWRRMESLNRWGAYRLFAAIEAKSVTNASAIVAITGSPGYAGALDAGQLMERVWIKLNAEDVGVQPFYVVADQLFRRDDHLLPRGLEQTGDALARTTDELLGLSGRKLYMLLRIGYPIRPPVKSLRLPLNALCKAGWEDKALRP